jgi:nucleoside-diphosphate-sugar epimerase
MKDLFITGLSGFVGTNIKRNLEKKYSIHSYQRNDEISINSSIVIHLAGKAHDTENSVNSNEYYETNTELTKKIFDCFLKSKAEVFIMLSSVKAVTDSSDKFITENEIPIPKTHYGKSKLLAEKYILTKNNPNNKRIYILRPCMIYGPGNKGNLNLLYNIVSSKIPWPLGAFKNKRSFCNIENLSFVLNELIVNKNILSGIYNIADDKPLSTNEIVSFICETQQRTPVILKIPKTLIRFIARLGDIINLPLNSERLKKLTESYIVDNKKIINELEKPLPIDSKKGMLNTFKFLNKKHKF